MEEKKWDQMTWEEQDALIARQIAQSIQSGCFYSSGTPYCALCGYPITQTRIIPTVGYMAGLSMHPECEAKRCSTCRGTGRAPTPSPAS